MNRAVDELDGLDLGDARLDRRARAVVEALDAQPREGFPQALGTVAAREGFYRLVNNASVHMAGLLAPHAAQTIARAVQDSHRPIVAIDKSLFVFVGEGKREGLEWISGNKQAFEAFVALAVSPDRRSHGVLAVETLEKRGRSDSSSWSTFINKAGSDLEAASGRPIYVMDREANAYPLFCDLVDQGREFVVRLAASRRVRESEDSLREPLAEIVRRLPVVLTRTVRLSRRKSGGRSTKQRLDHPTRQSRNAKLSVRATSIVVPRATGTASKGLRAGLPLNLVQVIELDPPSSQEPVEWLLLTNLPISDTKDVEQVIDAYRARWVIEEYFKALKTGCNYEARQLESLHALENALALLVPIAWRLLELRTVAEEESDMPAGDLLDPDELHVLRKLSRDVKLGPHPSAWEALLAIASLGGHIKQNGRPGWQVLYGGFRQLLVRVEGYRLAKTEM